MHCFYFLALGDRTKPLNGTVVRLSGIAGLAGVDAAEIFMRKTGGGLACNHLLSRIDSFFANLSANAYPLGSSKGFLRGAPGMVIQNGISWNTQYRAADPALRDFRAACCTTTGSQAIT